MSEANWDLSQRRLDTLRDAFLDRDLSSPPAVQAQLNVEDRTRKSLFPWRGQFSPQLIDFLLNEYAGPNCHAFDPFCGSGTTLSESLRRGLRCTGYDINPAAFLLSSMHGFANIQSGARREAISCVWESIEALDRDNLFSPHRSAQERCSPAQIARTLNHAGRLIFSVSLMRAMGDTRELDVNKLRSSLKDVAAIVREMPFTEQAVTVRLADSRFTGLPAASVDLVITSPPYINVFNYHQNYRPALESIGWKPLSIAPTEIGANRKHRGNRFLTVVQYCVDMGLCLAELGRLLQEAGTIVFVVGRCSTVRGVSFHNGLLLALLAETSLGLKVERWRERVFMNRFGERIYEDILTLRKGNGQAGPDPLQAGRLIGQWALERSGAHAASVVKPDVREAIERAADVMPSPSVEVNASSFQPGRSEPLVTAGVA